METEEAEEVTEEAEEEAGISPSTGITPQEEEAEEAEAIRSFSSAREAAPIHRVRPHTSRCTCSVWYADVCSRVLTYANVSRRKPTYADVR
jgi:hypothetical protein